MTTKNNKLALDTIAVFRIHVQGAIPNIKQYWENVQIETRQTNDAKCAVTIVTASFDQAGLLGFLRHLYAMGIPLLQVECLAFLDSEKDELK